MDQRLFFVLGDLTSNTAAGAIVGWLSWAIVGPGWNMWIAMILMMAVGMFIALLLWIPFGIFLGAMESMVPLMLTGMMSSMVVGMAASMHLFTATLALLIGAMAGLASIVAVWILNNHIRGITFKSS